ncbi:hypothetical protein SAMN04487866_10876 [Thermoactinomyces sp. DSM 45891]|uniref:hypothetical protein n=1 Tax=Thermoactinomyces sp. DSM 45891 TaxID=1761907 RepID=UPI00091D0D4C|nr:hypothetical protein [Thermoactinomyces sp. DSM 45891]SFX45654.1 hypothetical protein SAMN04487866_10876 [Thermoactinomyces sp. DSM 45891]
MKSRKPKSHKRPFINNTTFSSRKSTRSTRGKTISTHPQTKSKSVRLNFMESMKKLEGLAGNFSKKSSDVKQMIEAFQSFSRAFKDQGAFKQMIGALSQLNQSQLKPKPSPKDKPTKQASDEEEKQTISEDIDKTDSLFNLINSPGLNDLVKTVLSSRKKKK